ncbi:hypothetical protein HDU91_004240, partial [Kappamyces sp. JEL0680]
VVFYPVNADLLVLCANDGVSSLTRYSINGRKLKEKTFARNYERVMISSDGRIVVLSCRLGIEVVDGFHYEPVVDFLALSDAQDRSPLLSQYRSLSPSVYLVVACTRTNLHLIKIKY